MFVNYYECSQRRTLWDDRWDSTRNDRSPDAHESVPLRGKLGPSSHWPSIDERQMGETLGHTTQLQHVLERMLSSHPEAKSEILEHTCERLRNLSHKMMVRNPRVRRWAETDDVLQNALLRLHRSLDAVQPESPQQFYGLAATQVRRELLDLARHFYGAEGQGANHHADGDERILPEHGDGSVEPDTLNDWASFHKSVEAMPDEQRQVVDLLRIEGMKWVEEQVVVVMRWGDEDVGGSDGGGAGDGGKKISAGRNGLPETCRRFRTDDRPLAK